MKRATVAAGRGIHGSQDSVDRQTIIEGLNHDLAGEFQSALMYVRFAAVVTGPFRTELRGMFQKEVADELRHAQFLADKIAVLGGEVEAIPRPVSMATDVKEILHAIIEAEEEAIHDYVLRARQADEFGDIGLKVQLEDQIADETRHKEQVEQVLAGWKD